MTDMSVVSFRVVSFEWVRGRGRLAGLADVWIEIEGVGFLLQGVRVVREVDGSLTYQEPRSRHPDGRWLPVVVLPQELSDAMATAVMALAGDVHRIEH